MLRDVKQHLTALRAGLEIADTAANFATTSEWEQTAADLESQIVADAGAAPNTHVSAEGEAKPLPNAHDILKRVSLMHALHWRQLSDVFHGGLMGRAYQRRDLTFGVPAEPRRQDMVMHTAVSVMADLCRLWLATMGEGSDAFGDFALAFQQFTGQQPDSP